MIDAIGLGTPYSGEHADRSRELDTLPTNLVFADEQPPVVEIKMADGIFIKQMFIAKKGTYIPQHVHAYDHTSMLAVGRIQMWKDGVYAGEHAAPTGINIEAGVAHTFLALDDGVLVYCIHNISRTGEVEVLAEQDIVKG